MLKSLTLVAALVLSGGSAQAFLAQNGLVVEPAGGDTFDIPYRGLSGAPFFWCAAGDYARMALNLSPVTRIWRMSEPPRRSGEGIRFSLSPQGAATSTGLVALGGQGASLTVAHALALCERNLPRSP